MDLVLKIIAWGSANWAALALAGGQLLSALGVVVGILIAFFMVVPGDQPEKALTAFAAFIAKYSKK